MITFIEYLLMLEAKVDDLATKHPEHADAIHKYNAADPTSSKKFLPWLVKQHIAGKVTPEDSRLHSTLNNFDKVKHNLEKKDISRYNFKGLADEVDKHVKKKAEIEAKNNAVDVIHKESNGITAQHIKTKEASQKLYGGGEERGGKKGCERGTSWCVSARSDGNLFHKYGHMYTIHDPNDDNAPYAVHPFNEGGTITSRHNDGDEPHKEVVENNPHLKNAVNAIMKHSAKYIDGQLSLEGSENRRVRERAIRHPLATPEHITKALSLDGSENDGVRQAAIMHPNATSEHITKVMNGDDEYAMAAALSHPKVTPEHITKALGNEHSFVREAAISNPNVTSEHITKALSLDGYKNGLVRRLAITQHPDKVTPEHITQALSLVGPENRVVREQVMLHHDKITSQHITKALSLEGDENSRVRLFAITSKNSKVTPEHITKALSMKVGINDNLRERAINHPNAIPENITHALSLKGDRDRRVRELAISRDNATPENITHALSLKGESNATLRDLAINHKNATPEHVATAMKDDDPLVRTSAMMVAKRFKNKASV
jgi:hypothetical protein